MPGFPWGVHPWGLYLIEKGAEFVSLYPGPTVFTPFIAARSNVKLMPANMNYLPTKQRRFPQRQDKPLVVISAALRRAGRVMMVITGVRALLIWYEGQKRSREIRQRWGAFVKSQSGLRAPASKPPRSGFGK